MSHPTRVRGLKHHWRPGWHERLHVAPHAGAWIETTGDFCFSPVFAVAPHAGAWIETLYPAATACSYQSHPTRVRGLKPTCSPILSAIWASHPTRVRGLKRLRSLYCSRPERVAPHEGAWIETALLPRHPKEDLVAPHAGAWIETMYILNRMRRRSGRTPRGCVD